MDLGIGQTLGITPEADGYWLQKGVRDCGISKVWAELAGMGVLLE